MGRRCPCLLSIPCPLNSLTSRYSSRISFSTPPPLSLRSESTRTSAPNGNYIQHFGPREDAYAFLRSIQLRHPDIPDHEPYELWPTPQHILLLPQSYFEFDTHSPS
ncbi:hypothetical protein BDZ97DRAFT_1949780 [Flammula alnicola]|nr:hypothetical protein BDZ97DRAFT_1949780 [Flammula alnicola]